MGPAGEGWPPSEGLEALGPHEDTGRPERGPSCPGRWTSVPPAHPSLHLRGSSCVQTSIHPWVLGELTHVLEESRPCSRCPRGAALPDTAWRLSTPRTRTRRELAFEVLHAWRPRPSMAPVTTLRAPAGCQAREGTGQTESCLQGGGDEGRAVAADRLAEIRGRTEQGGGWAGGSCEELVRAGDTAEAQVPRGWIGEPEGVPAEGVAGAGAPRQVSLVAQGTEAGEGAPASAAGEAETPRLGAALPPTAQKRKLSPDEAGPGLLRACLPRVLEPRRGPRCQPATCPGHRDLLGFARACACCRSRAVMRLGGVHTGQQSSPRPGAPAVSGAV